MGRHDSAVQSAPHSSENGQEEQRVLITLPLFPNALLASENQGE